MTISKRLSEKPVIVIARERSDRSNLIFDSYNKRLLRRSALAPLLAMTLLTHALSEFR